LVKKINEKNGVILFILGFALQFGCAIGANRTGINCARNRQIPGLFL
jgi:hypothetical protein